MPAMRTHTCARMQEAARQEASALRGQVTDGIASARDAVSTTRNDVRQAVGLPEARSGGVIGNGGAIGSGVGIGNGVGFGNGAAVGSTLTNLADRSGGVLSGAALKELMALLPGQGSRWSTVSLGIRSSSVIWQRGGVAPVPACVCTCRAGWAGDSRAVMAGLNTFLPLPSRHASALTRRLPPSLLLMYNQGALSGMSQLMQQSFSNMLTPHWGFSNRCV